MAGHSKWAQIKRKKAAIDAKRGKVFTRLLKEITVATRMGGGDPDGNARLRNAIQDAKNANVPNDTIDRAVKKGLGELEGQVLEEVSYEGYGPGGVAVMIDAVTDNRNRTVGEIRHLFSRNEGNLGENGCVAWMFHQRGVFGLDREGLEEEALVELAVEIGAEDFVVEEDGYLLYTTPENYHSALTELQQRDLELGYHQLARLAQTAADVTAEQGATAERLIEALEEHDDVQNVWTNYEADSSAATTD